MNGNTAHVHITGFHVANMAVFPVWPTYSTHSYQNHNLYLFIFILHIKVFLPPCTVMCTNLHEVTTRPEESNRSPGTGVTSRFQGLQVTGVHRSQAGLDSTR